MSGNVADLTIRPTRQNDPVARRPGILPDRRDTRAPGLESFARMGTAARGDVGGATDLMRTLGVVSKAADSFQDYANAKFQHDEEELAGRGAVDQMTGHVDTALVEQSTAYRDAIELGREQANLPDAVRRIGEEVGQLVEHQTSSDPEVRRREVDQRITQLFQDYVTDPETGEVKAELTSSVAMRWLSTALADSRARLSGVAHARVTELMDGQALAQAGSLAGAQLASGQLDVAALRAILPPSVTEDQLRGTILSTVAGTAEQLKSNGRGADALRMLDQVLGVGGAAGAMRTVDVPPGTSGIPAAAPQPSSIARRRSRAEGIAFVLQDLEGGAHVVDNHDGGGTTKFGITKRHNPDVDVANLTFGRAKEIAESRYWQPAYNAAHPAVALIAFDAGFINSKSFGREIATKYANDPVGALAAYRSRLQDIATKPDKARFLQPWMNRLDKLGTYLGVGPGGQGSNNVIDDPAFALDPEPLDPVEDARRNPGASLAEQLTGGLALRSEERTRLLEYRDQLGREVKAEWTRQRAEAQDEASQGFLLRLSGLGAAVTPTEIAEAARRREISPQQTASLLDVIRRDADRDEARAERAANEAERDRDKADEQRAQGITASLMGPVYSGQRSPAEALRLFSDQAAGLDPKVRRAVLGAITSEANGIEEVRRNNPEFTDAVEALDDGEAGMLRLVRSNYRRPDGRYVTVEQQRALISLEVARAKRTLMRAAIDRGSSGNIAKLRDSLVASIKTKVKPYLTQRTPPRPN